MYNVRGPNPWDLMPTRCLFASLGTLGAFSSENPSFEITGFFKAPVFSVDHHLTH